MPIAYPDGVYYINASDGMRVTKIWIENRQLMKEQITRNAVSCYVIADGWLYGADDMGSPFAIDLETGSITFMGEFYAINVYVTYDSVYYRVMDRQSTPVNNDGNPVTGGSYFASWRSIRTGEWFPPDPPGRPPNLDWDPPPPPPSPGDDLFDMSGRYEIVAEVTMGSFVVPFEISGNYLDLFFREDGTGQFDSSINDNSGSLFFGSGEVAEFEFVLKDSILYMRDPRNRTGQTSNMNDVDYYAFFLNNVFHLRGYTIQPDGMGYRITLIKQ